MGSELSRQSEVEAFAQIAVAAARPPTPQRARALTYAARKLAAFGHSVGLCPSPAVLLEGALIERFILQGTEGLCAASVRTLACNLRALERAFASPGAPARTRLPRERAKPAYSQAEIDSFLLCARAQSTQRRRMRASALICLGAGAGIVSGELRHIKGSDVVGRSGGVLVVVGGARARSVPVLRRYHEPLGQAAAFAGEGLIVGKADPARRNLSDSLCAALCADPALPRLEGGRLRSTWLSECAQAIGLHAFMAAAGVHCSQRLGDIAATLPAMGETETVALLGGGA